MAKKQVGGKDFPWGEVIKIFDFDFDGKHVTIIKYHPWMRNGCTLLTGNPNPEETSFSVPVMSHSFASMDEALQSWLVFSHLGHNQGALASGMCRALNI
jgi:hypothetical protein